MLDPTVKSIVQNVKKHQVVNRSEAREVNLALG